jgi:predicted dehydrogenase
MLNIAIVGCGKIADEHAEQIARVAGCRLAAVCDREPLMAAQMHERFGGVPYFDDVGEMLRRAAPDVVHVTTPPQSHAAIAMQCLDAGCHVYLEKPFTVDAAEAGRILAEATTRGLKVTVGHNLMFTRAALELRRLVDGGYLGSRPLHCEAYYCYDLGNQAYARAFLGDASHWVRRLPGGLLHNTISHGISRIAEYLPSEDVVVKAHGFTSPALASAGVAGVVDELRVILESGGVTAYFTFSSQMRPTLSEFRLFGTGNGLLLSDNQHSVVRLPGKRPKSYLPYFVLPARQASQYFRAATRNVRDFARWRLHMSDGMKTLIERFYGCISRNEPPPFPDRDILLTVQVMDEIFRQVSADNRTSAACEGCAVT